MVAVASRIGTGIYTLREAAVYSRCTSRKVTRWLYGTTKGKPVFKPEFGTDEKLVSFLDLVQTIVIREIKTQKKTSLKAIRDALVHCKKKYNIDFPFARKNYVYALGERIIIQPEPMKFEQANGPQKGQGHFSFVQEYLEHLGFDERGLAKEYRINTDPEVPIYLRPNIRFGEPVLPSGYSAWHIWDAIKIEGGIEETAKAYQISIKEVKAAYSLMLGLLGVAA